jgi:RNA-binding motif X-linked protein 2
MNTIREIEKINQQELDRGIAGTPGSWHSQFANSAWCYLGNLDHQLTEGDILCIMSQYGEVEDIHLVREEDTGKSRGFAFIKYEDTRSCVLAVDNFCGVTILGRSLRVDHVEQYRLPKKLQEQEQDASEMGGKPATSIDNDNGTGHAYKGMEFENNYNIQQGMDLFAPQTPAKDKKYLKTSGGTDENKEHSAKIKRKEDRQQKRLEKEERRQRREERKEKDEEKRRKKRAREYYGDREAVKRYKRAR